MALESREVYMKEEEEPRAGGGDDTDRGGGAAMDTNSEGARKAA